VFVFGKKKKLEEFVQHLADLGNISIEEAQEYCVKNRALILNAFSRGLDPFSGVAYISEINMEKIHTAHALGEHSAASVFHHYWLLVSLQCVKLMQKANVPTTQLDFNFRYWCLVLQLPINPNKPKFTYDDRLEELVNNLNAKV